MSTITRLTDRAKRWLRENDITRELGEPETGGHGWLTRIEDFLDALAAGTAFELGAITPASLSIFPVDDAGRLSSFAAHFITGAFPAGNTIAVSATETWTGRAAPDPTLNEFLCGVGFAADMAAFVAAVNAKATSAARALATGSASSCAVIAKLPTTVLTGVSSHANCVISQAVALAAAAERTVALGVYTLDAGTADTDALAAGDAIQLGAFQGVAGRTPRLFGAPRRVTAAGADAPINTLAFSRSEERRVGTECRRRCRSRWSPSH